MAMDELFGDRPGSVFCIAEDPAGRVGGFLHLVPCPASGNYSMSAMRRNRATPNGLMEFLIAETLAWARAEGAAEVSLTFCVFSDFLRSDAPGALPFALRRLDRIFQLERLFRFSGKFFPAWRPRYLCFERLSDFPLIGLAWLWAEALIVPPLPSLGRAVHPRVRLN
jgi:lysyl-tRNA synthetase class 2